MSVTKRVAIGTGALFGTAGVAYVASRVAAGRLRSNPDDDASRVLDAPLYPDHRLTSHDGGSIYVVDNGNKRVLKLAAGSSTPTELPFTGLSGAEGVAVDSSGTVYVTDQGDYGNNRVLKLAVQ